MLLVVSTVLVQIQVFVLMAVEETEYCKVLCVNVLRVFMTMVFLIYARFVVLNALNVLVRIFVLFVEVTEYYLQESVFVPQILMKILTRKIVVGVL